MKNKLLFLAVLVFVFSFLTWSPNIIHAQVVPPTVTALGDGTTDYILPSTCPSTACNRGDIYGDQIVFSVTLDEESQIAVQDAINNAASTAPRAFQWHNNIVRMYSSNPIIFDEDVVVEVTESVGEGEEAGSAELTIIDSSATPAGDIVYAGGTGIEGDPFKIETCEQLQNVSYYASNNSYFILNDNINCLATATWNAIPETDPIEYYGFMPIGYMEDNDSGNSYGRGFSGTFDGNNKTISGLYINRPTFAYVGLFGSIGADEEVPLIKDLTISNANITAYGVTGILAGYVYENNNQDPSTISNVHTSGQIVTTYDSGISDEVGTGGLVGYISRSEITGSSSSAIVSGATVIGGLVGQTINSHIEDSSATGVISGTQYVGGLVGYNSNDGCGQDKRCTILNSHATGNISGTQYVGGLVGFNNGDDISLSYATGKTQGTLFVGGLVGGNNVGTITTSYAAGDVSGISRLGGLVGTNAQGHIENTYARGNVSGFGRVGGLVGETNEGPMTIMNSYATGDVSGTQYVGGLVGHDVIDDIVNSYSVGMVAGNTNTGGLVGYFDGSGTPYSGYIHNSGWYKGSQSIAGIGYDALTSASAEVDYPETNNEVFYSKNHEVYTTPIVYKAPVASWDFSDTWVEQDNDYPLLKNNLEERSTGTGEGLDLTITRVSVNDNGEEGNANSYKLGGSYDISEDGRYVAFVSSADNLYDWPPVKIQQVSGIYVYDTQEQKIELVSLDTEGNPFRYTVEAPSVSDDGRYVSFTAYNEGDDGMYYYIYLRDRQEGTTKLIDLGTTFGSDFYSSISGDGKKIVVSSPLINGPNGAYYYNVDTEEVLPFAMPFLYRASISKNGVYAVFGLTVDWPYVGDTNELTDIFVVNIENFFEDPETAEIDLISVKPNGEQFTSDDASMIFAPYVSEDGRYVTFTTYTQTNGPMGYSTIYLRDREQETTKEIYRSDSGLFNYFISSVSNDGRFIVFSASAMSAQMSIGNSPVYLYDSESEDMTTLIDGANNNSSTISGDGKYIVFVSNSKNLVENDNNNSTDVFRVRNPLVQAEAPVVVRHGSSGSYAPGRGLRVNIPVVAPVVPVTPATPSTDSTSSPQVTFTRTLKLKMTGDDVKNLQIYLNTHGYPVSLTGVGSLGHETNYFGNKTKLALIKFQIANNITPAIGIFGPLTRGAIK